MVLMENSGGHIHLLVYLDGKYNQRCQSSKQIQVSKGYVHSAKLLICNLVIDLYHLLLLIAVFV